jgi:hypothetical protein
VIRGIAIAAQLAFNEVPETKENIGEHLIELLRVYAQEHLDPKSSSDSFALRSLPHDLRQLQLYSFHDPFEVGTLFGAPLE